jgi:hypothetical protein
MPVLSTSDKKSRNHPSLRYRKKSISTYRSLIAAEASSVTSMTRLQYCSMDFLWVIIKTVFP